MQEPIKTGDRATIIAGALGDKGPNIGKQVTWWRVKPRTSGRGAVNEYGAMGDELDCAASWLQKIEPPPAPVERERKEVEA